MVRELSAEFLFERNYDVQSCDVGSFICRYSPFLLQSFAQQPAKEQQYVGWVGHPYRWSRAKPRFRVTHHGGFPQRLGPSLAETLSHWWPLVTQRFVHLLILLLLLSVLPLTIIPPERFH
mgnify:CR=1 FL=1